MSAGIYKACTCGKMFTKRQWRALPFVGQQRWPWGEVQELRNHTCRPGHVTTLVVVIKEGSEAA